MRYNSPFHEVDHVNDAWRADHGLVGQDGPHALFHTELRLQGGEEGLNLLSVRGGQQIQCRGLLNGKTLKYTSVNGDIQPSFPVRPLQ